MAFIESHIFPGTNLQNMNDCTHKGRRATGSRVANRLAESDITAMFQLRHDGWTITKLAARFRVTSNTVGKVLSRRTWAHVNLGNAA